MKGMCRTVIDRLGEDAVLMTAERSLGKDITAQERQGHDGLAEVCVCVWGGGPG